MSFLTTLRFGTRTVIKRSRVVLSKNAPKILIGAGIALGGATVATACTATLKCNDILKESDAAMAHVQTEEQQKLIKRDTRKKLAKACIKPVGFGIASVVCTLCGMKVLNGRAVKAIGAASAATSQLNDLHDKIIENFGPEIDKKLTKGLPIGKDEVQKAVDEAEKKPKKEKKKQNAFTPCTDDDEYEKFHFVFDEANCDPRYGYGLWRPSAEYCLMTAKGIYGAIFDRLKRTGQFTINDIMDEFRMPIIKGEAGYKGLIFDPRKGFNDLDKFDFGVGGLFENGSYDQDQYRLAGEPYIAMDIVVRKRPVHEYYDELKAKK